ncbi:MAG: hypothetical protein LBG18_08910 [Mediterranea sp.]|nr:hypothetical protein [Mediterranea sp.]
MNVKDQLRELYASKWSDLCAAMKPVVENESHETKPAKPLLLWPGKDDEYENADIRVMIVGKETRGWIDEFDPAADPGVEIEEILNEYDRFYYPVKKGGSFWNGSKLFRQMLDSRFPDKKIRYIWNNIIKMGKAHDKGAPSDSVYAIEQKHFSVVREEIEILKPHLLLFLTGHGYDRRIKDKLGELTFEPLSPSYPERELAKFKIPGAAPAYRTHHPNYMYRQGKGTIEACFHTIIDDVAKDI